MRYHVTLLSVLLIRVPVSCNGPEIPEKLKIGLYKWNQVTDQKEKQGICLQPVNEITKEGVALSPDNKTRVLLTHHALTETISHYHISVHDTASKHCLFSDDFEHEKTPTIFFTKDNKPIIKIGDIINRWEVPSHHLFETITPEQRSFIFWIDEKRRQMNEEVSLKAFADQTKSNKVKLQKMLQSFDSLAQQKIVQTYKITTTNDQSCFIH